jgi:hypothetical protein
MPVVVTTRSGVSADAASGAATVVIREKITAMSEVNTGAISSFTSLILFFIM